MKTIALKEGPKGEVKEGSNGRNVALHSPPYCFVAPSLRRSLRDREETEATEECMCLFSSFFSPSLPFSPEQPVKEERVKGDAVSQAARVSRPYLSLPAFLPPLLFCLRSKTRQETDGEDKRGAKKKRRGARLRSLMIT